MNEKAGTLYEFGPFRLDVSEHRLLHRQEIVPLGPKVFETLLVLIEHSGHVLQKNELMTRLWPDSFVEESSLTQNISLLRKALSEGGEQQFIQTVPKLGYRFVAPVKVIEVNGNGTPDHAAVLEEHSPDEPPADAPLPRSDTHPPRLDRSLMLSSGAILLLLTTIAVAIAAVYLWRTKTRATEGASILASEQRVRSLAVLPLKSLATNGNDEFLGLGMADALIVKLSNFEQFNVRPTSSVIKYAGREFDSRSAGTELGVDTVLDGTIQHVGDRVRVTVMLLSTRDGKALWSGKFDERFTDIFTLQDSISEKLAGVLQLQLAKGKQAELNKHFTENAEAYSDYTMGLYFWNKRTKEALTKAIEYFQKATEADPNYALAYAMLADTYCLTIFYEANVLPSEEVLRRAEDAVVRARQLDDTLAEAYAAMGILKTYQNDAGAAAESYQRAIELNPNSAMAHNRYAYSLLSRLQLDDAIREMSRAQELDPISLPVNTMLGACFLHSRQYDEAIKYSKLALEVDPQFGVARFNLGEAYEWKGLHDEAVAEYTKLTEQPGFRLLGKLGLALVYARSGRQDEARRLLAEAKRKITSDETFLELPFLIGSTYAVIGDKDEAFVWLEKAIETLHVRRHDLRYNRALNTLKDDPRFEQMLRRHEITKSLVSELLKHD
ncbi:MAG TPA: tetratricopeptide repeat protein [Pyrinomonadaceae bacterium]|nr:tetratricopeptide repeat protein [Pyrinomonadaceae bacterium]